MTADGGELALTARNASAEELVTLLREQQERKVDVVATATAIRAEDGLLVLDGTVPVLGADGVTMTAGAYRPTDVCDGGIADKLGIPAGYLRRMRVSRPGLFDANVNGWLAGDDRSFFVRCLRGEDGAPGVARAWLSDGYKPIDHLDTLTAVFAGIRAAGYPVTIDSCDLTGRRMYVWVRCEAVQVLAPALLSGYRSPFTGAAGADNPVVFAGFVVANSETGCGACTVTPRLVAQVCSNGMTITRDAVRACTWASGWTRGFAGPAIPRTGSLPWSPPRPATRSPRFWPRATPRRWSGAWRSRPGTLSAMRRRRWGWSAGGCATARRSKRRSLTTSSRAAT